MKSFVPLTARSCASSLLLSWWIAAVLTVFASPLQVFAGGCENPTIITPNQTTFNVGTFKEFDVRSDGDNGITSFTCSGTLPPGVAFEYQGGGMGRIYGTPAPGSAGVYNLVLRVENCAGAFYNQNFTLTVAGECVAPPGGMIHWWPGDGSANDIQGLRNGTLQSGATFAAGKVGQAFSLDGVNDWVVLGDVDLPATFTIDAWIKPNTLTNDPAIISKDDGFGIRSYWFGVTENGSLAADVQTPSGTTSYRSNAGVITTGVFQLVAVTYDGSAAAGQKLKFYVNGVQIAASFTQDEGGTPWNTALTTKIGVFGGSGEGTSNFFNGLIDEVELFSRTLTQAEIQAIFDAGGFGKCKPIVYVSNLGDETVERFDLNGNASLFASSGLNNPEGLAFDTAGNLYVANSGENTIRKYDAAGNFTTFADLADGLNNPRGIAFDGEGNLFVANAGTNSIWKITPAGVGTHFATMSGGEPYGLAFDAVGNLYVARFALSGGTIDRFTPAGSRSIFADAADGISGPIGLAFDRSGNLYVANFSTDSVTKLTPAGVGSLFANNADGLSGPYGLAFDRSGYLYVVNEDVSPQTVVKIDPAGNGTLFANTGLSSPGFIAIKGGLLPTVRLLSAHSRKTHANGAFDLDLTLTGTPTVEGRSRLAADVYEIVLKFPTAVTYDNAFVTPMAGKVAELDGSAVSSPDGKEVTIKLKNVSNTQTLTLGLLGASNGAGVNDVSLRVSFLAADTTGDGFVNSGDAQLTRNRSGETTGASNFRSDVNLDGAINSGDASVVRSRSGSSLSRAEEL